MTRRSQERVANLSGGVAILKVGATTESGWVRPIALFMHQ